MVMEAQSNQPSLMTEDEVSSISDVDNKVRSVKGQESHEPIKFGATINNNLPDGPTKEEVDEVNKAPKNAVDEWPEPKQIHAFYFVRCRPYDDPKIKAKTEQVDKEIQKKRQARSQIIDALKAKRAERSEVLSQLKPLTTEDKNFRAIIEEKRKEMEPYQAALSTLRTVESARKSEGLCSSEEELDDCIRNLNFRLQHESNTIAEEKQILKDIKYLEATRDKVIANAAMTAKIGDSFGQRDDMRGQVKQLGVNLDAVRKDQQSVRARIKKLEEKLVLINSELHSLEEDLADVEQKTDKAFEAMRELRKSRDEMNACFQQSRLLLNSARELAARKDVTSLEELCKAEGEKFMSQWNSTKAFRDDYERRILTSLDARQLSRDGRMRNPGEKPIVVVELPAPMEVEAPKAAIKKTKDDANQSISHDVVSAKKAQRDDVKRTNEIEARGKMAAPENEEKSPISTDTKKESAESIEMDYGKLKEIKKAEEITKAKQALERKKKLAEKAAAKAAAKAQKEAEKKLKEKEKKARKKAGQSAEPESAEQVVEDSPVEEPDEVEVVKEAPAPPSKAREPKESVRYRGRPRGSNQPPKFILNRKKTQSYWIWAVPASAALLALSLVGIYYHYVKN